VEIA
jgi:hypothetical protein